MIAASDQRFHTWALLVAVDRFRPSCGFYVDCLPRSGESPRQATKHASRYAGRKRGRPCRRVAVPEWGHKRTPGHNSRWFQALLGVRPLSERSPLICRSGVVAESASAAAEGAYRMSTMSPMAMAGVASRTMHTAVAMEATWATRLPKSLHHGNPDCWHRMRGAGHDAPTPPSAPCLHHCELVAI